MVAITSKELLEEQIQEIMSQRRKSPRGVELSKRTGIEYNTQLQFLTREVKKDIDTQLIPLLRKLEADYTADASWFGQIAAMLQSLLDKWSSPTVRGLAEQLAQQFVTSADKVNEKRVARQFGVNIYSTDPQMTEVLEAAVYNNTQLIRSIPVQYLAQVENIVLTNTRAGNRSSAMVKALQEQFGVTQRRAKMIARDQTAKVNGDLNAKRQQVAGFPYFQWMTSNDERVRDRHEDIAEKITEYGKGVYRWDNPPLSDKGIPIIPGSDYQCFPGESQLNNTTFCNVLYRRWYTGELTELVFDDGVILSATANHPILTDKGFKPIQFIDSSDNIIRTLDESFLTVELNRKGMKPTFEQMFSALDLFGVETSVSTGVVGQFHGDGSNSDVDIIEFNGLLRSVVNPSIIKKLDEIGFTGSDKEIIFNAFSSFGNGNFSCVTFRDTLGSLMSRFDLSFPLFFGHFTPLECFGLALGSWYDSELLDITPDDVAGNTEMFSDCVFAFAVLVHGHHLFTEFVEMFLSNHFGGFNVKLLDRSAGYGFTDSSDVTRVGQVGSVTYKLDKIVDKRSISFSNHVYNLQTISGDYNTGATVVSNCRCTARPVSQREVDRNKEAGRTRPGVKR